MISQILYFFYYGFPGIVNLFLDALQDLVFLFKWLIDSFVYISLLAPHFLPESCSVFLIAILAFVVLYKVLGREG